MRVGCAAVRTMMVRYRPPAAKVRVTDVHPLAACREKTDSAGGSAGGRIWPVRAVRVFAASGCSELRPTCRELRRPCRELSPPCRGRLPLAPAGGIVADSAERQPVRSQD